MSNVSGNRVGEALDRSAVSTRATSDPLLRRFARRLWDRYRARVYLFGSRAGGTEHAQSDYDLVAVAAAFANVSRFQRCLDRDSLWLDAGGWRRPLDLHCYTPEEFRREKAGLGYLGQAHDRGDLLRTTPAQGNGTASSASDRRRQSERARGGR